MVKFSENSIRVLESRYLIKNEEGKPTELPEDLFKRVAKAISAPSKDASKKENIFFNMMLNQEFMPNSPTLMNAGMPLGMLSACFVLPIGDSMEEIFDAVKFGAIIHKMGGGTGYSFSNLRPKNDFVQSTSGVSCFTGDQKVLTQRGLIEIQHIKENSDYAFTKNGKHRIIELFNNGLKKSSYYP